MKITNIPGIRRQSFKHRMGSRYGRMIDRNFITGYDPFDDHQLIGQKPNPKMNLKASDEYYELELPVPGFKREEISIVVESNILKVHGAREVDTENNTDYIVREHDLDVFERHFELGEITDQNRIDARFINGILYIRLYHKYEEESGRTEKKEILVK